jgi:Tfp pilus assembly protein PilF
MTTHRPSLSARAPAVPEGRRLRGLWALLAALALGGCASAEVEKIRRTDKADFHYRLANGYFHTGSIDLSIRELIAALEVEPDHADSRYLYGFILFGRKQFEEAAGHFRKAVQVAPAFYAATNILGATYIELERYHDAIATLEPLTREPRYTTPYHAFNNLGLAYFRQGDLRNADKNFGMSVFYNPKFCQGYRNLALVALGQRDYAKAVDQMGEAVMRCPRYAELHLQQGEAFEANRQFEEADKAFQKCVDLAGETSIGRRCRARLRGSAAQLQHSVALAVAEGESRAARP